MIDAFDENAPCAMAVWAGKSRALVSSIAIACKLCSSAASASSAVQMLLSMMFETDRVSRSMSESVGVETTVGAVIEMDSSVGDDTSRVMIKLVRETGHCAASVILACLKGNLNGGLWAL